MNKKYVDDLLKNLKERRDTLEAILTENGVAFGGEEETPSAFKTECRELKKLKVAAVMDAFTLGNFKSECVLREITSDKWKEQIDEFGPDLFFLESAWNGKDNSWYKKIANGSKDLYDMTAYCHEKGIPVIFWNKEDPVYTDVFMSAASCADYVFTTDFDCIERYKRTLQHDNVYLLHFSAQPLVHNPLEIHDRKDKFCFAGAYYHRYKDRSMVFDAFADVFEKGKGLDIFDRNLGSARPEHAFPARYNKMIIGNLKPEDIHIAYKGYNYGINMNSVGQSQTMFARRVFELLASNTVSVGNYARGAKNLFGDLTVCTNSADEMKRHLDKYCGTPERYRKYRLLGLRAVMEQHLCEDRLGYIAQCVFGRDLRKPLPEVVVISAAKTEDEKNAVQAAFDRQTYAGKTLVFPGEGYTLPENVFVASFDAHDHYGENYLKDLVLSVRYSDADGFGKNCYYEKMPSGIVCGNTDGTYKPCTALFSTRSIVKSACISDVNAFANGVTLTGNFLCTDEFNYCRNNPAEICEESDDLFVADKGIDLSVIHAAAKSIHYAKLDSDILRITPQEMMSMCHGKQKGIEVKTEGCRFLVSSKLKGEKTAYVDFSRKFLIDDFFAKDKFSILFQGSGELDAESVCTFYDGAMKELGSAHAGVGRLLTAKIPDKTKFVKLSLRIKGSGEREFSGIMAGGTLSANNGTPFLSRSETLVLADHYPAYDDLYRYMFVHKRNLLYKESGLLPDMMCINMWNENGYREFEGINVTDGDAGKLSAALENGRIKTVCVHFLTPYLWSVLKNYLDEIRLIVWSHGSDIQPWYRRKFNYKTEAEIEEAKKASEKRVAHWKEIFAYSEKYDIRFVYVSEFFKKQIEEDYGVDLSEKASVIHNCIDTELFSYQKKDPGQRFSIMSVKSFSTLTYANDITQQAILKLSEAPEFSRMTIDLYGDGERFDEDTHLLKKFSNVHLHRGFLTQSRIAELHKTHGIYIATTRMDTQGVSRDEAMSSGLVPVANAVAAIPEFVKDDCGIVVPPEDAQAVADAILKLVREPELFAEMSENAARYVREHTAKPFTIDKEVKLIESRNPS